VRAAGGRRVGGAYGLRARVSPQRKKEEDWKKLGKKRYLVHKWRKKREERRK
jgi:hypothetical protein